MKKNKHSLEELKKLKISKIKNKYLIKITKKLIKKYIKNIKEIKKKNDKSYINKLYSIIDKLSKKNIFHKNKSSRLKKKLIKYYLNQ